ncbi:MAG: hypothetical protein ACRDCW_02995 [Sarcina sp.]
MSFTRRYLTKVTMETLDKSRDWGHDPDESPILGAVLCILLVFGIVVVSAYLGVI